QARRQFWWRRHHPNPLGVRRTGAASGKWRWSELATPSPPRNNGRALGVVCTPWAIAIHAQRPAGRINPAQRRLLGRRWVMVASMLPAAGPACHLRKTGLPLSDPLL
ncbi:MAG: hypothetical protein ACYCXN_16515, partial [Acidimicrobiales bacterium]